jgi:hypothetical protein
MIEFGVCKRERETARWYAVRDIGAVFACLDDEDCRLAADVCEAAGEKKTGRASYGMLEARGLLGLCMEIIYLL